MYYESSASVLACSPRATTLFRFLLEKAYNVTKTSFWRTSKIAAQCGFSLSTYHRAIRELVKAGFVSVRERLDSDGRQTSNEYTVLLPELSKKDSQQPAATSPKPPGYVRLTGLSYKIYLYIQMRCGRKGYCVSNRENPSACGVSLITVRQYVRKLQEQGYIQCETVFRQDNGQGDNFYATKVPARIKIQRFYALLLALSAVLLDTPPGVHS